MSARTDASRLVLGLGVALAWQAAPAGSAALAQEPPARRPAAEVGQVPEMAAPSRREMAGHQFIVPTLIRDPFAITAVSLRTSFGVADARASGFNPLTGEPAGMRDYTLAALSQSFEFQWAPLSWLTVRLGGAAIVYSGVTSSSALGVGASARAEPTLGVTLSRALTDRIRVGFSVDYRYGRLDNVNIVRPIAESLQRDVLVGTDVYVRENLSILEPAVSAAFALHPSLGITASLKYVREFGERTIGRHADNAFGLAAAADFDLNPLVSFPMAFMLGYGLDLPFASGDEPEIAQELLAGFFYTGRKELDLGIELSGQRFTLDSGVDIAGSTGIKTDALIVSLAMRYFW